MLTCLVLYTNSIQILLSFQDAWSLILSQERIDREIHCSQLLLVAERPAFQCLPALDVLTVLSQSTTLNNTSAMKSAITMMLLQLLSLALVLHVGTAAPSNSQRRLPTTTLETGQQFPMVGLEVDGIRGQAIGQRISDAMQNSTQFALFDTAQRANNEKRINLGIANAVRSSNLYSSEVHVVTKVPYTHLGYERTKLSVKER